MKFKAGDKVIRTGPCCDNYTVKQGNTYTVHKVSVEANLIFLEGIVDSEGKLDWFNPYNFELVKENTPKFKKGDKVKCIKFSHAMGVEIGNVYTVKNPKHRKSSIHEGVCMISLEEEESTPLETAFELYEQEVKNYRHLSPDTLIPISIDGVESEVHLGDLVHAQALLGTTDGLYGCRMWEAIKDVIDPKMYISFSYSNVQKLEEQKVLFSKFFIDPKKEQQKEDIKKTILAKETELKQLQNLLKELD